MNSTNNMSIAKPIIASGLVVVEKIGVNNLDIYIPRIGESFGEDEIKFIFADMGIGMVNYVDFVATKDPETKQIKFYSAFLRLLEWNPDGYWYKKIIEEKRNKIQISASEYWVILPAKTPLSRSKVNTHQLAAYTDELFVKMEAVEKSVTENMTISSVQFNTLLSKFEEQSTQIQYQKQQIEHLLRVVENQNKRINNIDEFLLAKQSEEAEEEEQPILTLADLEDETDSYGCENCGTVLDTQKQLHFHSTVCKEETQQQETPVYCDDECFFLKPLSDTVKRSIPTKPKLGIMSGTFSMDIEDVLGPVAKSMGITREEVREGLKKEFAKSSRAKSSKNFCGNA
jgi:hypothetical protein